mmetsp:Transcript_14639/g.30848  ORF Transcript_14639/g.30848 Transcript_14639/m.30848 type:complete len:461 (-) Transcript_14639:75-1457(-)
MRFSWKTREKIITTMTTTTPPKLSHRRQRSRTVAVITPFLLILAHVSISTTSAFHTPIAITSPSRKRSRTRRRRHNCSPISTRWLSRTSSSSDERNERRSSNHDEANTENNGNYRGHRWRHEPFDFSSRFGWDSFYKNGLIDRAKDSHDQDDIENDRIESNEMESLEYEWHGHIPHSVIVQTIAPSVYAAHEYYHSQREQQTHQQSQENKVSNDNPTSKQHSEAHEKDATATTASAATNHPPKMPSILIAGCGNSSLPRILHDAFLPTVPVRVTCLDYSPVCIDMISKMYGRSRPNMDFVVGDATNLKESLMKGKVEKEKVEYDVIVDKGLLDALLCGEGFDRDVERLVGGIREVLTKERWGMHVLVCFRLSRSLKESLVELGTIGRVDTASSHRDGVGGATNGYDDDDDDGLGNTALFWEFDIPVEGSETGRASFNLAMRCEERKSIHELETLCTDWKL